MDKMSDILPIKPNPSELLDAALANIPFDMAASYEHMATKPERKDVVANRLAKNIGPLLGIPDPAGPFGEMSWLCDFRELSLGEIAHGAPEPTREEIKDHGVSITQTTDWCLIGRGVYGKTPNHIVSATMNRFAPDTKAGAMLTGVNQLLSPQVQTLKEVIATDRFASLTPDEKIQACGNMIFRAYAPQPLLFEAGIFARTMQRALKPTHIRVAERLKKTQFARCEIPALQHDKNKIKTFDFNIVDRTAESLAQTLKWANWPHALPSTIVADGILHAIRATDYEQLQATFDPATQQHTMRSHEDPSKMGSRLMRELRPYLATA